ncbi:hypothetical protein [Comamonas flocculans]|uniref:Flagellar protein FlgN n=1 Tax=Comamonas flocculans TaxID=2597701 RepID=A0A5B8RXP2_9BURK|nr:hypothetical protein [Comamonas flocculans]QEA12597.1 hypothetical protein FOZ74_05875 [Comamonas flocculans]
MVPAPALDTLEAALAELQAALADPASPPHMLEQRAHALRQAMTACADALDGTPAAWPPDAARRLHAVGARLASTREQLARVLAITAQQAASLLPHTQELTYGPGASGKAQAWRSLS